jgi:hypothetical protein
MNEITKKILIINQFLLPDELIDIIKNYVFYNIMEETKKRKNKIISLFNSNNIYYSNSEKPDRYPECPYPIISILMCDTIYKIYDKKWYFFLSYCKTCGKYIRIQRCITYIKKDLHCDCYD